MPRKKSSRRLEFNLENRENRECIFSVRKILIATPLKGEISKEYNLALLSILQKSGPDLQFSYVFITGTAVHFARNEAALIARRDGYTDIIWWDADLRPTSAQVDRLLSFDEDIVAMMYPRREVKTSWHITAIKDEPTRPDGLQKVFKCAIGFSIMKVSALNRIAAAYPDHDCIRSEQANGENLAHLHDFFPMGILGPNSPVGRLESIKRYLLGGGIEIEVVKDIVTRRNPEQTMLTGEDYYFCRLALGAGISIHLDTQSIIKHKGDVEFPIETEELKVALAEGWRQP